MASQTVLVTGGAGFVGSSILSTILSHEPSWTLYSFDLVSPREPLPGVKYLSGSIKSATDISSALSIAKPTVIIATAGIVPPLQYRYNRKLEKEIFATNISGTEILLAAVREAGCVRALIWTSSCCAVVDDMRYEYPNISEDWSTSTTGSTVYGESKARAEPLVLGADDKTLGFRTCVLRPSVVFGPEDYQLIPSIHACIAKLESPFVIGTGLNLWDVTDVRNVSWAHLLAVRNLMSDQPTAGGQAIFVANDEPIPFRHFCLEVWKSFGHHPPFEVRIPEGVAQAAAGVANLLGTAFGMPVTLSRGSVRDACATRYCDGAKAKKLLGYEPVVGIEQGIRESCERLKERLAKNDEALKG